MAIPILMPALSPTMEEGTLAKWLVKEGDSVRAGDVIAEIETDKATMEVEAVDEGVVEKLLVPAGSEGVKVNAQIALLRGEGEAAPAPAPPKPEEAPKPPAPKAAEPAPAKTANEGERVFASPLARRLAEQGGVDLSGLKGSGPQGRIVKQDVESALRGAPAPKETPPPAAEAKAAAPAAAEKPAATPAPVKQQDLQPQAIKPAAPMPMPYREGEYDLVPLDGMRKVIARRMTQSFRDIPHFPLTIDVEIDRLLEARKQLNARLESDDVKLSVNDFVIRACALALKKTPDANVSFAGDQILRHKHAHVAVAVAIEGGLVTPVIFKAEGKGLAEISAEMKSLAEKARARKLRPQDYEGGTFTVSNLGMYGIKSFASILNEPQAMILSVGAGEPRPVVKNGALQIATVMSLTLTCDHRAVDGAVGSEFLGVLRRLLEDPMMMMA